MERPAVTVGPGRQLLRALGCAAVLITGVALIPPVRGLPPRVRAALIRAWARLVLGSLGVRVRVRSADGSAAGRGRGGPGGGALLVANHVSWLDILLIAALRPARMMAKTEVRRWPLLGPLAAWGGTLFIDRDRLRALPGTVAELAGALRRGERVAVFPEGSTWCGRAGGRFRPALFQAALDAGVPVQPMALRYRLGGLSTTAAAFVGEDGLLFSLRRVLAADGLVAEVVLPAPLPSGQYTGRRELARAAQAAVDRYRDGAERTAQRVPAQRAPAQPGPDGPAAHPAPPAHPPRPDRRLAC